MLKADERLVAVGLGGENVRKERDDFYDLDGDDSALSSPETVEGNEL